MAATSTQEIRLVVPRSPTVEGWSTVSIRQTTPGRADMGFFAMTPFDQNNPPVGISVSGASRFELISTLHDLINAKVMSATVIRKGIEVPNVHRIITVGDKLFIVNHKLACLIDCDEVIVSVEGFDVESAPTGLLIHGVAQESCNIDYSIPNALSGLVCTDFAVNESGDVEVDKRCTLQNYSSASFNNVVSVSFKDQKSFVEESDESTYSTSRSRAESASYSSSSASVAAPRPVSQTSIVSYKFNPPLRIPPKTSVGVSLGLEIAEGTSFVLILKYHEGVVLFTPALLVPRQIQETFLLRENLRLRGVFGTTDVLYDSIYVKKTSNVEDLNLIEFGTPIPSLSIPVSQTSSTGTEKQEVFQGLVVPYRVNVLYQRPPDLLFTIEKSSEDVIEPSVLTGESPSLRYWDWYVLEPETEHTLIFNKKQ